MRTAQELRDLLDMRGGLGLQFTMILLVTELTEDLIARREADEQREPDVDA